MTIGFVPPTSRRDRRNHNRVWRDAYQVALPARRAGDDRGYTKALSVAFAADREFTSVRLSRLAYLSQVRAESEVHYWTSLSHHELGALTRKGKDKVQSDLAHAEIARRRDVCKGAHEWSIGDWVLE